jgi:hemoglobin
MAQGSLLEQIGGRATLERVHRLFYDRVYAHSWLSGYFQGTERAHIENQQTEFMMTTMGGERIYCGSPPKAAHAHIFINDELFDLRHQMLADAIRDFGLDEELAQQWLKIDAAFRSSLVKGSRDECQKRFPTDQIVDVPRPK